VLTLLIVVFGYVSWTQLTVEAYPGLSDVTVQVTTQVPGLAAEEIEQQITDAAGARDQRHAGAGD
jgi:cobalt-zinc-cadmium resistance protein CzcA